MGTDTRSAPGPGTPRIAILAGRETFETLRRELATLAGPGAANGDGEDDPGQGTMAVLEPGGPVTVHLFRDAEQTYELLRRRPVGAILLDNRESPAPLAFGDTLAGRALPELLAGGALGRVPVRRSILLVLPEAPSTADHAYAAGTLQLGGVLVAPPSLEAALRAALRFARPTQPGKVALCMAGGGIEGMFWELGVLRALDAHLGERSVVDFDVFTGISAGAVLGAFLANGVRPAEIADALQGRPSRVSAISRAVLFNPNVGEAFRRVGGALLDAARGRFIVRPIDSAMRIAPTALFSGDRLREYLRRELSKPGLSDDFEALGKELYIGATDQETWVHVTFGAGELRRVPISTAVRASTAMTPYYAPERVDGRFFVDGIFTRTIDLDTAVARGARLLLCIDPLTPVQVDQPGYVSGRGGFFNTVQSVKSMIRTRFSEVMGRAEEAYPDVSVFVFSPTPSDLEQMSGTMMRFLTRTDIEQMAFESAAARIRADHAWLAEDLWRHGFRLER
jgi:predicted acylesterase/phospholipase RssA